MNVASRSFEVFRIHGGKVEAARALFPEAREPWIDMSTGISPWAYSHNEIAREAFTRLPDAEGLAGLEAAAAASFGVSDASSVIASPGSDLALRALGRALGGASRRVAVVRPGYSGHVLMWNGAPVTSIGADDIDAAAREHDVVILANPNNPDGRWIPRSRLLEVAGRLAERAGTLIVDEAFADVRPEESLCSALADDARARGVIVLRSFGKFFGLAGVRLGFVVMSGSRHSGVIHGAVRHALGDWPVSGPAVALGTAAYRDVAWQSMQRDRLTSAAQRLDDMLTRAGLTIEGGTALFRLARCTDADALFMHLASHGVLTRPFSSDRTLLRVGLPGDESHWQRLAVALNSRHTQ